jgi:hypothetical protein
MTELDRQETTGAQATETPLKASAILTRTRGYLHRLRVSRDREHGFHRIVSKYFAGS